MILNADQVKVLKESHADQVEFRGEFTDSRFNGAIYCKPCNRTINVRAFAILLRHLRSNIHQKRIRQNIESKLVVRKK